MPLIRLLDVAQIYNFVLLQHNIVLSLPVSFPFICK